MATPDDRVYEEPLTNASKKIDLLWELVGSGVFTKGGVLRILTHRLIRYAPPVFPSSPTPETRVIRTDRTMLLELPPGEWHVTQARPNKGDQS